MANITPRRSVGYDKGSACDALDADPGLSEMNVQLGLFDPRYDPERLEWLRSPPGTMAPWVIRERTLETMPIGNALLKKWQRRKEDYGQPSNEATT